VEAGAGEREVWGPNRQGPRRGCQMEKGVQGKKIGNIVKEGRSRQEKQLPIKVFGKDTRVHEKRKSVPHARRNVMKNEEASTFVKNPGKKMANEKT